jgi:hypothetical protein
LLNVLKNIVTQIKKLKMASIYYPSGCDDTVGDHFCDPCETPEHGRVRSVFFTKASKTWTDIEDQTEWNTAIADRDVIVIAEVNGTFDGGAEVEGPGYGDQATKLVGYNFTLNYKDPNYAQNADFYNAIKRSRNYRIGYRTETKIHESVNTVSIIPKNPVPEDLASEVVWDVTVKWQDSDLPIPHDTPEDIFTCFQYASS